MLGFLFALLSATFYGIMNVLDKYIVAHHVKRPLGYTTVTGVANMIIALLFALFLDWSNVQPMDFVVPTIIGVIFASLLYFYYIILQTEDISHFVGLRYLYPVLVALLSFVFLKEHLSLIQYLGMFIAIGGVLLLSGRIHFAHHRIKYYVIFGIVVTAISEFLVKVTTSHLAPWNGVAISLFVYGLASTFGVFHPTVRKDTAYEFHNIGWAAFAELFDFAGLFMLFLAMAALPATIVSSTTAARPLLVIFFEWIAQSWLGKMVKDNGTLQKLGATALIVLGVVLLYV